MTTYTNTQALKPWLGLGLLYKNIDCVVVDVDVSKKKNFFGFFFWFFLVFSTKIENLAKNSQLPFKVCVEEPLSDGQHQPFFIYYGIIMPPK